jgi:O-antigen ligase
MTGRIWLVGPLALLALSPWLFGCTEGWSLGLMEAWALLLGAGYLLEAARSGGFARPFWVVLGPLMAGLALCLLQLLPLSLAGPSWPPDAGDGSRTTITVSTFGTLQAVLKLAAYAIVAFLVGTSAVTTERLFGAVRVLVWVGFALAVFGMVQSLAGAEQIYWLRTAPFRSHGFFGPFVNRNHFAGFVEACLPFAFAPILSGAVPREQRPFWAFQALVMGAAVMLSQSRAGVVAVGVEMVVMGGLSVMVSRRSQALRRATALASVTALALAIVAAVWWAGAQPLIERFTGEVDADPQLAQSSRSVMWRDTLAMIGDNPIFGTGVGAYEVAFTAYTSSSGDTFAYWAHSDVLQLLADGGLVGAAIGVWFVIGFGLAVRRGLARAGAAELSVVVASTAAVSGLLVHGLVDFNLEIASNGLLFVVIAALGEAASRR